VRYAGRRVGTAIDSNSPKVHRREDELATVHIKPCMSPFLLNSRLVGCLSPAVAAPPPSPPPPCPPFFTPRFCAAGAGSVATAETCVGAAAFYCHRPHLAEGTSPRESTCHCTHKAVYLIFSCCTAAELSITCCESTASPLPSFFISRVLPASRLLLQKAVR
jgi:hypothetical protein